MKKDVRLAIAMMCLAGMTCACGSDGNSKDDTPVSGTVENTRDLCSDNLDNDGNGLKDCDDPGCRDFAFCDETEEGKENTLSACMDKADNDGDGLIDCDDSECQVFAICQEGEDENTPERCQDSKDNDKDGLIDCQDPNCQAFSFCSSGEEETKTENSPNDCLDGEDNDGDGKTDCCDEGCKVFAFCANACAEDAPALTESTLDACTDGEDNDKDGFVDCLDPDCHVHGICVELVGVAENTRELCSDGMDNDYNGVADKDDPNCKLFYAAGGKFGEGSVDLCKDGQDNDGDGAADCNDPECQVYDFCMPDYPKDKPENDKCPDDPFKFKEDECKCGETLIGEDCYINVASVEDFDKMADSADKFILKQNVNFGTTNRGVIKKFSGVFDGGNKRIAGVINQAGVEDESCSCGLFGVSNDIREFRNIDLAITLNCDCTKTAGTHGYIYAGALASRLTGTAKNITGSSKVYVEEYDVDKQYDLNQRYSLIKIGGIFGYVMNGSLSDIHIDGNVSAYLPYKLVKTMRKEYYHGLYIGGVAGDIYIKTNDNTYTDGKKFSVENITANTFVTLSKTRLSLDDLASSKSYLGGIIGNCAVPAKNVHNQGVISLYSSGKSSEYWTSSFVGGLFGMATQVTDSSFSGRIVMDGNNPASNSATSCDTGNCTTFGSKVGGIAAILDKQNANYIDHCSVDAEFRVVPQNAEIGGILGRLDTASNSQYVRNSSANIDLYLINDKLGSTLGGYYGGIVGRTYWEKGVFSGKTGYIVNNSARTRYHVDASTLNSMVKFIGGICGYSGIIVNCFASDEIVCDSESCTASYTPKAIGGEYVYESYWNRDTMGAESGATIYTDASAEPYTYNLAGVPVTRVGKTVLGLLRYNAGHDGGVLSAHIPANIDGIYYNWTTLNDKDGHEIPVPADQ